MQISGNFSISGTDAARNAVKGNPPTQSATATTSPISTPVDQLDLSPEALSSSGTGEVFRSDKVADLREAIAQGNYDTDEKLSIAMDKMLDQLG